MLSLQATQTQPAGLPVTLPPANPAVEWAVQLSDVFFMVGGALTLVWWVVYTIRAGRWRNPLAGVCGISRGPHLTVVLLTYSLLYFFIIVLSPFFLRGYEMEEIRAPGTHAFHIGTAVDMMSRILTTAVVVGILAAATSFTPRSTPRSSAWRRAMQLALVGLFGFLAVHVLVTAQLQMSTVLWNWILPEVLPPQHPVLLALHGSAWGWWGVAQLFVSAVIVAPLSEELMFRGLLLQSLWRHTRLAWVAIAGSGFVFGLIHFPQPQAVLPLATMGLLLGYVRVRYRSLTACVLIHALFNARTIVVAWVAPHLIE